MSLTRDFCLFITVDIFCNCALFDEPLRVYIIFTVERIIHYCRPIKSNTSRSEMRKKKLVGITQRRIDRYRTSSHICCRPVVVVVFVFNSIPIELLAIQYRRYEFFFLSSVVLECFDSLSSQPLCFTPLCYVSSCRSE